MPRRAAAQIRPVEADPIHRSKLVQQVINKVMLDGKKSTAERIVYDALALIGERSDKDPIETLEASIKVAHPDPRGQIAPRRRRHLPGARRGRPAPRPHAGRALARRVRPPAPREDDGPAPRQRADWTRSPSRAAPTSARTTSTAWRRPTRPSPTTAGSQRRVCRRGRLRRFASGVARCARRPRSLTDDSRCAERSAGGALRSLRPCPLGLGPLTSD